MLVNCVAYQNGKKLGDITVAEISDYVTRPECFVWVALFEPTESEIDEMALEFDLHPLAVEDARKGHQRPKIEEYDDSLFVVIHTLEPSSDAADHELQSGEIDIFVGRNYILSVRSGAEKGFQDVRTRAEQEPELLSRGPGYVLYALMDAVVDRYFPLLDALETELERIEEQIFAEVSPRANIEALYGLKQKLMVFRHAVRPLLESLGDISGARVPLVCAGMREYFRDVSDHLQRLDQTIESIRETVSTAISVNLSMINLQENATMKRLAAYAALIAVPTMIVGVYGMNFEYMPELHWRYGYALVLGIMAAVDGYIFYRLRRSGWL